MSTFDQTYAAASRATGKSVEELKRTAVQIFASMLFHAMSNPGSVVWTITRIEGGNLEAEVNVPRRSAQRFLLKAKNEKGEPIEIAMEPTPCCICGVEISLVDFTEESAMFAGDESAFVVAHVHHFYEGQQEVHGYAVNMKMMAAALAKRIQARPDGEART